MKTEPFSTRAQAPRAESASMKKSFSLVSVFMFLTFASLVTAQGLKCTKDADCRRNVCIFSACGSRPLTEGTCQFDNQCFYTATESCIQSKCKIRSKAEEYCDTPSDCATSGSVCESDKCFSPLDAPCSKNSNCVSPLACIKSFCKTKSDTGGDCDEEDDCAKAEDICSAGKKCSPFQPSILVWEGNKAPTQISSDSPSIAVGKTLYVFEGGSFRIPVNVEAYDTQSKVWSTKTGPGILSLAHNVVAVGATIFLVGGYAYSPLTTFFAYDTGTDKWDTEWDQLPAALSNVGVAAVDDTVYLFGGIEGSNTHVDKIRSLDVSTKGKGWNLLSAKLPQPTSVISAATVGKDIYLISGTIVISNSEIPIDSVLKFSSANPNSNPTSTGISALNEPRQQAMSFFDSKNNRLYAVGGVNDGKFAGTDYLDLNDPGGPWISTNAVNSAFSNSGGLIDSTFLFSTNRYLNVLDFSNVGAVKWTPFSNAPFRATTVAQLTAPNTITVVDTLDSRGTAFYNIATDTWAKGSATFLTTTLVNVASAVVNGELYVLGGEVLNVDPFAKVYVLNAAGTTWSQQDNIPERKSRGCAAADGTDIYLYGGTSSVSSSPNSKLFKMDTTKDAATQDQWSLITPVSGANPTPVAFCAAVVANGKFLVFGGSSDTDEYSPIDLIQSFDIASQTWDNPIAGAITARSRLSAVFLKGFVFLIGGTSDTGFSALSKVEVFDVNSKTVSTIADMPTPRFTTGLVTDGPSLFSFGGMTSFDTYFNSLEKLRLPLAA